MIASGNVTQVLYLDKSLTIRGGYRTTAWKTPDPVANPTILDAQGQGRAAYITGPISPTLGGCASLAAALRVGRRIWRR